MNELGQRARRRFRPSTCEAGEAREHRVCLLKPDVRQVAAVAGMPLERRPAKPLRVVDQEQHEFEGVGKADVVELGSRGEGDHRVAGVESSAEATVSRGLGGHEQMFARYDLGVQEPARGPAD